MPSKDFNRMIELGEWLEKFLTPDIKSWDYRKLAQKFIDSYNIDYGVTNSDVTIKIIELIENQPELIQKFYKKPDQLYLAVVQKKDPLKLREVAEEIARQEFDNEDDIDCFLNPVSINLVSVYEFKDRAMGALQLISESERPWGNTLFEQSQKEHFRTIRDWDTGNIIERKEPLSKKRIVNPIEHEYERISTALTADIHLRTFSMSKKFNIDGQIISKKYGQDPECNSSSNFPWGIAVARTLIDFLILGGQEYFLFCEHCGRFTVIRRKGRKKYCSDVCRTTHGREKKMI